MFIPTKTSAVFCLTAGLLLPLAGPAWADHHAEAEPVEAAAEAVEEAAAAAVEAVEEMTEGEAAETVVAQSPFDNPIDELSYAIGVDIGSGIRSQDIEINPELLAEAFVSAYTEGDLKMTSEQCMAAIQRFQQEMQMKQMEKMMAEQQAAIAENTAAAEAFFAENITKEGVQQTESGLQYQIVELGDGPKPGPTDQVTIHYKGQLLDGSVFDSSYDRGEPVTVGVDQFVTGFAEGLQLMPVGSKGKLFIPGEIAYGLQGGPGGPNATLIFDVEIIAAEPTPTELEPLGD
ncbi:MAG: FKBP-type peptidyl-prolyl cis-trans isomerase [Planctomycetota bacterium]